MRTLFALVVVAASTAMLFLPAPSTASTTDDTEVRKRVACLGGTAELRLKIESGGGGDSSGSGSSGGSGSGSSGSGSGSSGSGSSGGGDGDSGSSGDGGGDDEPEEGELIQVELRINVPKPVKSWRVVMLHERRLIVQGRGRSGNGGHSYRLRRTIPNWPGTETVVARMTAPNGRTCRIAATL